MEKLLDEDEEDAVEEFSDEEEVPEPNTKWPLPMDSHGSFMLAILRFQDAEVIAQEGKLSAGVTLFTAAFVNMLCVGLQLYLAFLMYVFVIERKEDPFEGHLHNRTTHLQQAIATKTPLDLTDKDHGATMHLCFIDHSVPWSQSVILFLWFAKCSVEVAGAFKGAYVSFVMPSTVSGDVLTHTPKGSDNVTVTRMSPALKAISLLLVKLPRLLVALILMYVGAKFLAFAGTVGELVMKSIGIGFISAVNALLLNSLGPAKLLALQKTCAFHYHSEDNAKNPGNAMLHASFFSILSVLLCAGFAVFFSRVLFGDIQEFRGLCNVYEEMFKPFPVNYMHWVVNNASTKGFSVFGHVFHA